MKIILKIVPFIVLIISILSCNSRNEKADGYGNFEATEIIISAENTGKIEKFDVNEGNQLKKNQFVGFIDTIPISLKREQLQVSKAVIQAKSKGVISQISVLESRLKTANINKKRIENLLKDNAGTQKQLDEIIGEMEVIKNQIRSVELQNSPVISELKSVDVQLHQLDDQLQKSKIINPIEGTVLTKYAEQGEITVFGKPLYKIADLSIMQLRVYISESQLANVKLNQQVTIKIDDKNDMKSFKGTVSWISSEAEFTPKIIQTKEERVALVYAVKINVINDGSLKIGMPAEMWIKN